MSVGNPFASVREVGTDRCRERPEKGQRCAILLAVTRLGFLLDSGACIGCHACTVACKSEHDVPLGVNRTWVNYVETGEFPQKMQAALKLPHEL